MRHYHVAIGAGLLIKIGPADEPDSFWHIDLYMVDEVAVPDRLEQAVCEAEGKDVLRRFLAEAVIDAEYLILSEHFVHLVV